MHVLDSIAHTQATAHYPFGLNNFHHPRATNFGCSQLIF